MLKAGDQAPKFETRDVEGISINLESLLKHGPVALVFLRYVGCPICRMHLSQVQDDREKYEDKNIQLFIVMESEAEPIKNYLTKKRLSMNVIPDPQHKLYDLYEVKPGTAADLFSPKALVATVKATLHGHLHGAFEGHEFQLPAAFVIGADGRINYAYYGTHFADKPPAEEMVDSLS